MSDVRNWTFEDHLEVVLQDVGEERAAQVEKWGQQDHASFRGETDLRKYASQEMYYKAINDARVAKGELCWDTILLEEVFEALAEPSPELRRIELIQVAAVALAEVESLDRLLAENDDDPTDPEPGEEAVALKLVVDENIPAGAPVIFGDFDQLVCTADADCIREEGCDGLCIDIEAEAA